MFLDTMRATLELKGPPLLQKLGSFAQDDAVTPPSIVLSRSSAPPPRMARPSMTASVFAHNRAYSEPLDLPGLEMAVEKIENGCDLVMPFSDFPDMG